VEVVSWTDERILLRVAGVQTEIPLRLYVTASPRWEAHEGGHRVPLREAKIGGGRFLELIARPGLVEFQFYPSIAERVSPWVSIIALLALIPLGLASVRRAAWASRRVTVGIQTMEAGSGQGNRVAGAVRRLRDGLTERAGASAEAEPSPESKSGG
jgi:hypothetical protein